MEEFMTEQQLVELTADELLAAVERLGVMVHEVTANSWGIISVVFVDMRDAEAFMSLGVDVGGPGSLYDRAASACVSMSELPDDASDEDVSAALMTGWTWDIHPHMTGRRMGWHVNLDFPADDARTVTARLNELGNGGIL